MTPEHSESSGPTHEEREAFLVQLRVFLDAMYPNTRSRVRRGLIDRARRKGHYGRLGEIAGILVDNAIRHNRTDYERLMGINGAGEGLTRHEARMVVKQEVADITKEWRQGSAETDAGYLQLRKRLRLRRRRRKAGKHDAIVIATDNEALAAYLREWLERRALEVHS